MRITPLYRALRTIKRDDGVLFDNSVMILCDGRILDISGISIMRGPLSKQRRSDRGHKKLHRVVVVIETSSDGAQERFDEWIGDPRCPSRKLVADAIGARVVSSSQPGKFEPITPLKDSKEGPGKDTNEI